MSHGQRMDSLRRAFSAPPWLLGEMDEELLCSLSAALTHDSYSNEAADRGMEFEDNERLEFLGDAALELSVRAHIYLDTPLREGQMTALKQLLVSNEGLAGLFLRQLSPLIPLIRVGEGQQELSTGILAGCLEALIGAVYLHRGMKAVGMIYKRLLAHDEEIRAQVRELMAEFDAD